MDQTAPQLDDLHACREAMRERLRLKAERVLEAVEEISDPKTFLEVERAARAILATDKMVIQLFSAPKPPAFGMRFGASPYDDDDRAPSYRMPNDGAGKAVSCSQDCAGNAPSGPLGHLPRDAGEDDLVVATNRPASRPLGQHSPHKESAAMPHTPPLPHGVSGLGP